MQVVNIIVSFWGFVSIVAIVKLIRLDFYPIKSEIDKEEDYC